jgi:hypothetical protein
MKFRRNDGVELACATMQILCGSLLVAKAGAAESRGSRLSCMEEAPA